MKDKIVIPCNDFCKGMGDDWQELAGLSQKTFVRVLVTPETAKKYLQCNTHNRSLSSNCVAFYSNLMRAGKWGYTPSDPIVFDKNGILINGQHRLAAVVKSGTSQYFDVVRNAPQDSYIYMDCGKMRSMADVFTYNNVKNASTVASIIKSYFVLKKGLKERSSYGEKGLNKSRDEYLAEYYSDPAFYDEIVLFSRNKCKKLRILRGAFIGGLYVFLVKDRLHKEEKVREFFDELYSDAGSRFEVIKHLKRRLINDNIAKTTNPVNQQALIAKAWNVFITNRDRSRVKVENGEKVNFI